MSKINKKHLCPKCRNARSYSYRYDAFYCEHCQTWLEETCGEKNCIFCEERPEKPKFTKD